MKTQLTNTKISGHGYKKGRVWNLAHLLPKRLALISPAPAATAQPSSSAPNPVPSQKPDFSNPPNPRFEIRNPQSLPASSALPEANGSAPVNAELPSAAPRKSTLNLEPGTLNGGSHRTRTGKIARLPSDIREIVNGMLRGGFRYDDIVAHLNDLGHSGITARNISFWKHHGYIDWLNRQHELEAQAVFARSIEHCIRAIDVDQVQQSAIAFAADQLRQIVVKFDHRRALDLLHSRPELFPTFVNAIGTLSRSTSQLATAFDTNKTSEALLRQQPQPPTPPREVEFEEDDDPQENHASPTHDHNQSVSPVPAAAPSTMSENPSNPNQSQVIPSNPK